MKHGKQIKLVIPLSEKDKVKRLAASKNMDSSSFMRYLLYEAVKTNLIINSVPTMKSDSFLKFKAPVELVEHIKLLAQQSNTSMGSYIRTLIYHS